MNIFQPLIDHADAVTREANTLHQAVKDCHDLMELTELVPCPACSRIGGHGDPRLVSVPPTIDAPNCHGLAVRCGECGIQTAPHYWHITEPEASPYSALYDAYDAWGFSQTAKERA
jgi:transcription elongation factor Elf1